MLTIPIDHNPIKIPNSFLSASKNKYKENNNEKNEQSINIDSAILYRLMEVFLALKIITLIFRCLISLLKDSLMRFMIN